MQAKCEQEIYEYNKNCKLKLVNEYANQTGLKYIRVEENQKEYYNSKEDADILNSTIEKHRKIT